MSIELHPRLSRSTSELSPPAALRPPSGDLEPSFSLTGGRLGDCEALELSYGGVSDILQEKCKKIF